MKLTIEIDRPTLTLTRGQMGALTHLLTGIDPKERDGQVNLDGEDRVIGEIYTIEGVRKRATPFGWSGVD